MQSRRFAVFRPSADRSYRILYGNARADTPEYEIAAIVSRDQQASAPLAELGPERRNEDWVTSAPFTERHPALLRHRAVGEHAVHAHRGIGVDDPDAVGSDQRNTSIPRDL